MTTKNNDKTKINENVKNFEHLENGPKRMVKYLTMGSLVSDNVGGPALEHDCIKIKIEKASEQARAGESGVGVGVGDIFVLEEDDNVANVNAQGQANMKAMVNAEAMVNVKGEPRVQEDVVMLDGDVKQRAGKHGGPGPVSAGAEDCGFFVEAPPKQPEEDVMLD